MLFFSTRCQFWLTVDVCVQRRDDERRGEPGKEKERATVGSCRKQLLLLPPCAVTLTTVLSLCENNLTVVT